MMVIFLVGLVSMILMRTLRKDYARYSKEDDLDEMVGSNIKLLSCSNLVVSFRCLKLLGMSCHRNADRN